MVNNKEHPGKRDSATPHNPLGLDTNAVIEGEGEEKPHKNTFITHKAKILNATSFIMK